jgi:hypothetical protein
VGHLDENPCSVARIGIAANSSPVTQVYQYLESFFDYLMTLAPLDVGDNANPAGIVFLFRGIQALSG